MQVTRFAEARSYEAPEHFGMALLRLQGKEASRSEAMWAGLSHLLPGGRTSLKPSAQEKFYLVLAGEVVIGNGESEVVLGPLDSCLISRGEARIIENRSNAPASVLLVMEEG